MLVKTCLILLVAMVGYLNSFFASSNICRPIVMGALVGIVLGDIQTGIKVGAALELVWLGAMAIGASNPPDMISGSVIGTAYVIMTGQKVAAAVALATPISMLMQTFWNTMMMTLVPMLASKAEKYAKQGNARGVVNMHYLAVAIQIAILSALTAIGFYVGSATMETVMNQVPQWIISGLNYTMGIIPAIGFAMLVRMIVNKKTACFLFLGFLLAAYAKLSVVGITAFACVLAAILLFNMRDISTNDKEVFIDDNEF